MKKKSVAGAAKKLAGSSALLEDKKHKEIVLLLLFFRENSKLLWLNKLLFYLFYILCSFTLLGCGEKNILPNLTNSAGAGFFGPLEPVPLEKNKYQDPEQEPLGEKIRSRSRLKKVRCRRRKKISRLPSPN